MDITSINNKFESIVIDYMKSIFGIRSHNIILEKIQDEKNIIFSKKIYVTYKDALEQTIQCIFYDKSLEVFKSKSELALQSFYENIDINVLFANILGLFLFKLNNEYNIDYLQFKPSTFETISPKKIKSYPIVLQLSVSNKESNTDLILGYIGFSTKEEEIT